MVLFFSDLNNQNMRESHMGQAQVQSVVSVISYDYRSDLFQAGDTDSSRAPGLTSGLQGPVNVHRGALLLVPQWQCISSFVFYMYASRSSVKCQD